MRGTKQLRDELADDMKTQGEIEAAVCEGMSRFEQEFMGRGPKDIRTHLIGNLLVIRLQGVLTAAEQHLVKTLSPEKRLMLREGLLLLPEPIRTAFVLHHYDGWQIESNDPQAPTIAKHFGKTPRTIRNWMAQAEAILESWRGEKQ